MTSLLQTKLWADFKARHGWRVHQIDNHHLLERTLPFGQHLLYAPELSPFPPPSAGKPRGLAELSPEVEELARFIDRVRHLAGERNAFVVRLEFLEEWSDEVATQLRHLGLQKSFEEIQPEYRQWVDLQPSKETILVQMKPKGRYNIRLAEKHGITVTFEPDPQVFVDLMAETARRDRFTARAPGYYCDLIQTLIAANLGQLLVARWQNLPLAAAIISFSPPPIDQKTGGAEESVSRAASGRRAGMVPAAGGGASLRKSANRTLGDSTVSARIQFQGEATVSSISIASYLHGASSSAHRDLMAPYALHWHAIQEAKQRGCTFYDLLAVDPQIQDTRYKIREKYRGISRFKRQFGGRTVHLLGSWDLVIQPMTYHLFQLAEQLRRR